MTKRSETRKINAKIRDWDEIMRHFWIWWDDVKKFWGKVWKEVKHDMVHSLNWYFGDKQEKNRVFKLLRRVVIVLIDLAILRLLGKI